MSYSTEPPTYESLAAMIQEATVELLGSPIPTLSRARPHGQPRLRNATDPVIFQAAREANAIVLTKDDDFVRLIERHGPPPQVVWLTCGNTSNKALRRILETSGATVRTMLEAGEPLVEISGAVDNSKQH